MELINLEMFGSLNFRKKHDLSILNYFVDLENVEGRILNRKLYRMVDGARKW